MSLQTEIEAIYENGEDALRAAVQALGGAKVVAHRLWPAKPIPDAHRELLDALNADRPRKLEINEILRILRWAGEIGFHSTKHFIDAETGYAPSAPLKPADEMAELQQRFVDAVKLSRVIADRIERLAQPPLQVVKL